LPLFQKSVINSIKQDESLIASRWNHFQNYLTKIDFIKAVKEEKYQDGFLKDIFESCLGYTLDSTNPASFNLEREKKNETDGKKADGVIYVNGAIIGIVELKDQKTKNLDAVESQAFNYHASHSNSKYIIISNFDELRFYIDKKTAYEKFNLFTLTYDEFKKLHLLMSFESLKEDIPLKIKEKSASFEQTISKELYKYFSAFRTHLFENIVKNNYTPVIPCSDTESTNSEWIPCQARYDEGLDKQTLLRLTQKLCDRIIFILFAEDRGLLGANTIKEIREHFKNQAFTTYALYDIYKFYFQAINEGNSKLNIPKYNGGLFATDEMLDNLKIDDSYLDMEAQKLSDFDFESDISVNILGHIFEQSLTDLEEMEKSFSHPEPSRHTVLDTVSNGFRVGARNDKVVSKRKKDGVFYTPEYITRYIVENTLGKLCSDKKTELKIEAETVVVNPRKLTKAEQNTKETLITYREWLTHLKILDPACGSGAFLNQALEFLIREHTLIRDLLLPYEDLMIGYEIEKSILEHNLYGVDINEDAVEIARLSLWLRTAHKGRELINLGAKIKCGNSLISDRSVAENAFVWEDEFPEVFAQGGFDVVIGNPPYGAQLSEDHKKYLKENYSIAEYNFDTYNFFFELSIKLLKENGYLGFITPNTFLVVENGVLLRDLIFKQNRIIELFESFDVFPDAVIEPITSIIQKQVSDKNDQFKILLESRDKKVTEERYFTHEYVLSKNKMIFNYRETLDEKNLYEKIASQSNFLNQFALVTSGIKPYQTGKGIPKQTNKVVEEKPFTGFEQKEGWLPLIRGTQVNRYSVEWDGEYIQYGEWLAEPRKPEIFFNPKIFIRRTDDKLLCTYDDQNFIGLNSIHCVQVFDNEISNKYLLAMINSKLSNWFFQHENFHMVGKPLAEVKVVFVERLPIVKTSMNDQKLFIEQVDLMLNLTKQLQTAKQNFINELHLEKAPQKLQKFEELDFDEFVKEYTKAKKLKFADKLEERNFKNDWSALFENDKKAVLELKEQITKTDKEIDAMVYTLYGLSEDEIGIVEGSK
jgi:hypothetical protein